MAPIEVFAPAKINLTLHVTGQRADGYHLLDSLVMFADVGDVVRISPADRLSLAVTGPMARGVPADDSNLCWRAAEAFGAPVAIELDKRLPAAAGLGGGSSDAAAVLRGMEQIFGRPFPGEGASLGASLGADVPVCRVARAARMSGIGEVVEPLSVAPLWAVLVNPAVGVSTPAIFGALTRRCNPPMSGGPFAGGSVIGLDWLRAQRNDMQEAAMSLQPVIAEVLAELDAQGALLSRMSGSGATCFGLFGAQAEAAAAARRIGAARPGWWSVATCLS